MPTRIIIEGGSQSGQSFSIQEEIFRVGTGEDCKLRLQEPGLPRHAATVEWRGGQYQVYNKGDRPIRLENEKIDPGKMRCWSNNHRLHLSETLCLRLQVEGDPAPAKAGPKRLRAEQVIAPEEVPVEPDKTTTNKKKQFQLAVIALCGIVVVLLLLIPPRESESERKSDKVDVDSLLNELRTKADPVQGPTSLAAMLEKARFAERRDNRAEANGEYRRILLHLQQRYGEELNEASEVEQQLYRYARDKLGGQ